MKVGMYIAHRGRHEGSVCLFICSGCGRPITNLREANFAPQEDRYDKLRRVLGHPDLELMTDEVEIYHWDCDNAGVPWVNAHYSLIEGGSKYQSSKSAKGHSHLTNK